MSRYWDELEQMARDQLWEWATEVKDQDEDEDSKMTFVHVYTMDCILRRQQRQIGTTPIAKCT